MPDILGALQRIAKALPERFYFEAHPLRTILRERYFGEVVVVCAGITMHRYQELVRLCGEFEVYDFSAYEGTLAERMVQALADKLEGKEAQCVESVTGFLPDERMRLPYMDAFKHMGPTRTDPVAGPYIALLKQPLDESQEAFIAAIDETLGSCEAAKRMASIILTHKGEKDATEYPLWAICRNIGLGRREWVDGPFFSRDAATTYLNGKRYRYGDKAFVYCFSGHHSWAYRELCKIAEEVKGGIPGPEVAS